MIASKTFRIGVPILSLVLCLSMLIFLESRTMNTYSYRFAFIRSGQLGVIDPQMPENTPTFFTLDYATRTPIATVSPNGKWIAIAMLTPYVQTTQIEIFDVLAGRALLPIEVGKGFFMEQREFQSPANLARGMIWSPDSQYLALSMYGPSHADIFVYSTATQSITDITANDPMWHYGIAWANKSDQLITESEACANTGNCPARLQLEQFNVAGQVLGTVDISDLYKVEGGDSVCNLEWSPSDRYISFKSPCDLPDAISTYELYLWDRVTNTWRGITNFTKPLMSLANAFGPYASYSAIWLNADQLLVSAAIYSPGVQLPHLQTIIYQPSTNLQTNVAISYIDNWSLNPVSGQLAYNTIQLDPTNPNAPATSSVKLATIDSNSSSASILQDQPAPLMAQIPNGCDLAWSPDGHYLAFASGRDLAFKTHSNCDNGQPLAIGFLDNATSAIKYYDLPDNDQIDNQLIGWVVAPGQNNPAATASPTAIRSPAAPASGSVPGGNQIGG